MVQAYFSAGKHLANYIVPVLNLHYGIPGGLK
jgi:hypothetical protein